MKIAEVFVKSLEKQGVKVVFGLPGEELEQILYYLEKSSIKFITVRHEQAAAFAAAGYGRVTGQPGVCLATLGPGATNLVTGVAEAQLDNFPLIAINAQQETNPHQRIDTVGLFKPISKKSIRLNDPVDVEKTVEELFQIAKKHPQGVGHIEISSEFASIQTRGSASKNVDTDGIFSDNLSNQRDLIQALEVIERAHKGIIIAGGLVSKNGNLRKELLSFAKHFNLPVVTTYMGKGSISDKEGLSLLSIGLGASPVLYELFGLVNLIVTVGYDPVEGVTKFCNPNADIIEINAYKPQIVDICKPAISLIGNVSETLNSIKKKSKKIFSFPEADQYRVSLESRVMSYDQDSFPFHPLGMINALRKTIPPESIILTDVGAHKMWVGSFYPVMKNETVIIPNGFSSMGFALPAAIGAKIAQPKKKIVAICGDGGFLMNVQELETAVRLKLNMTIIVIVDETFSLIKAKFKHQGYDTDFTMRFDNPAFAALAESFGVQYMHASKDENLTNLFEKALALEGVSLITIPIEENIYDELFA